MRLIQINPGVKINGDSVQMIVDEKDGRLLLFLVGMQVEVPLTERSRVLAELDPPKPSMLSGRFPLLRTGGEPQGDPS